MKLRSLFSAVAGALMLTTAFVPRTNADQLFVYFNFEDPPGTGGRDLAVDNYSDALPGTPGALDATNTGGGTQFSILTFSGGERTTDTGLLLNRSTSARAPTNDLDTASPGSALTYHHAKAAGNASISFTADTNFLTNLSLSMAIDNAGNGYDTVTLTYTNSLVTNFNGGSFTIPDATVHTYTFNLAPANFPGTGTTGTTTFTLTFSGGQSNGNNRQFVIDNIQLYGTAVPEPATVAGGLLGAFGLCWHQRRRLVRSLRFRPA
jgi:hypothetical protein